MTSLATVSKSYGDVGPGFDSLRILLSIGVVATHSVGISYGTVFSDQILHMPVASAISTILPLFFALSGYLVMGSAMRTATLHQFLLLRVLRIVPALATEIMLSALLIGLIFSKFSLWDYLADDRLHAYFGSLFGRTSLFLPGVFSDNPLPDIVNGSLWTINPEIFCYVFLGLCLSTRIHRQRVLMLGSFLGLLALCLVLDYRRNTDLFNVFSYIHVLILAFSAGNVLYLWRDKVPYSPPLFAVCLVAGLTLIREPYFVYVAVCGLTYCVVYLGFQPLPKPSILKTGDYSYGIYLYGFPIQQAVSNLAPWSREWYLNLAISTAFHLHRRRNIVAFHRKAGAEAAQISAAHCAPGRCGERPGTDVEKRRDHQRAAGLRRRSFALVRHQFVRPHARQSRQICAGHRYSDNWRAPDIEAENIARSGPCEGLASIEPHQQRIERGCACIPAFVRH